jgi:hypothetical protein
VYSSETNPGIPKSCQTYEVKMPHGTMDIPYIQATLDPHIPSCQDWS